MRSLVMLGASLALTAVCVDGTRAQTPALQARAQAETVSAELRARWAAMASRGETPAVDTEPTLAAASVVTPQIDVTKAPGLATISLTIDPGTVGVAQIQAVMASPSGAQQVFATAGLAPYPVRTHKFSVPFQIKSNFGGSGLTLYAQPGAWTIQQVTLISNDGNFVNYYGPSLAAVFPDPVVNVANSGTPDSMPPVLGHGKILTQSVSLSAASPFFAARVLAADTLSGVSSASLTLVGPPGSFFGLSASSTLSAPLTLGNVDISTRLYPGSSTGLYSIAFLSVCDAANNCNDISDPAALKAMFGRTTFEVTN